MQLACVVVIRWEGHDHDDHSATSEQQMSLRLAMRRRPIQSPRAIFIHCGRCPAPSTTSAGGTPSSLSAIRSSSPRPRHPDAATEEDRAALKKARDRG
jgi:hypothetical protein